MSDISPRHNADYRRIELRRRTAPEQLRYLADKLAEPDLHIGQISGVAMSPHIVADELEAAHMNPDPTMTIDQVLWECFRHFVHMDEANAAFHTAQVRYSPITFRLAEHLAPLMGKNFLASQNLSLLRTVLAHVGAYEEDTGR